MEKFDTSKIKEAIKYALGGLAIGTIIATGMSWTGKFQEKSKEKKETIISRIYSPLSYLELIEEENRVKSISQKNLFNHSTILKFNLDSNGRIERIVEDSSLWGKPNYRTSSPKENETMNWKAINKTAERYISYFEKKN